MNVLFFVLAAVYAAVGFSTLWAPILSIVFFASFGFAIWKALTFKAPVPVRAKRSSYK